ncbi:MAG: DUF58 domain-containing protein [Sulfolobales archaeon]
MLKSYRTLMLTLLLTISLSTLAVIVNIPTNTPYSPFNTGVNGVSKFTEYFCSNFIYSLSDVFKGFNGTIVVVLNNELQSSEYSVIEDLLSSGSTVVILDEYGYSNNLLKYLGLDALVVNHVVLDEVFKYGNREYPLLRLGGTELNLTTYGPTYIYVSDSSFVVAETSKYSYIDLNGDGYYSLGESMKSYPVVVQFYVGRGRLVLISDLDVISNGLFDTNKLALIKLVGTPVYIVINHLVLSNTDYLKYVLIRTIPTGYRSGFEGSILPYAIIVAVSTTSYYLFYTARRSKKFGEVNPYILICSSYVMAVIIYKTFVGNDLHYAVPAFINLIMSLVGIGFVVRPVLIATLIYYSSLDVNLLLYLLPTYILLPYLMTSDLDFSLSGFLGPSTVSITKFLSLMILTSLVNLSTILPISLMITTSLVNCLINYVRLYGVKVELLEVPKEAVLRDRASLLLNTYSKLTSYLTLVGSDGGRRVFKLKDYSVIRYDLPTDHAGTHTLLLGIAVMDELGFARRLLTPISFNYLVVPHVMKLLESIKSELFSRRDVRNLLSSVELSIIELGGGLVSVGSGGIAKALNSLVVSGEVSRFLAEFVRSLTALEAEIRSERLGGKVRYGEYVGIRHYVPGDEVKHVHWSKSLSLRELVVKEFTLPHTKELIARKSDGLEPIVMVDLTVSDAWSLDKLLLTLLSIYLNIVRIDLEAKVPLVILSNNFILVIKGRSLDVLYKLYKALGKVIPKLIYDYKHIKTEVSAEYLKDLITHSDMVKYFAKLVSANKYFAEKVIKALVMNDLLPPKPFTIIHSDVLNVRYGLVRYELSIYGYSDVEPSKLVQYIASPGDKY